jgi:hypothetical protein
MTTLSIIACHDCIEPSEDRARRFFAGSAMLSSGMFLAREWDGADPDTLVHFVTNPGTKTRARGSSRSRGTIQGNVSESERLGRLLGFTKQDGETAPAALARLRDCLRTYLLNGGRFLTIDPGKGSHYYLELTAKDADQAGRDPAGSAGRRDGRGPTRPGRERRHQHDGCRRHGSGRRRRDGSGRPPRPAPLRAVHVQGPEPRRHSGVQAGR